MSRKGYVEVGEHIKGRGGGDGGDDDEAEVCAVFSIFRLCIAAGDMLSVGRGKQ